MSSISLKDKSWIWGYIIPKSGIVIPLDKKNPDVCPGGGKSGCSLETAAAYFGAPNVLFVNSNHDKETLRPEYLDPVASCKQVLCGLEHGSYEETARMVSKASRQYQNLKGGLIDDFMSLRAPSANMTVKELSRVQAALKSENQELKLYVVRYLSQDQRDLEPYLPYIDVINLWVWVANAYDWQVKMPVELLNIVQKLKKPVLLGLYLHDYGGTGQAIAMDVLEIQMQKAVGWTKNGLIEGFVFLQNSWFDQEDHRRQVQWTKSYLDWASNTLTHPLEKS